MLTRPEAPPGPASMGSLSDSLTGPDHSSRLMMPCGAFLLIDRAVGGPARRSEVFESANMLMTATASKQAAVRRNI